MRIGIDAGCLGIDDNSLKGGIYRMTRHLLLELSKMKIDQEFILYSFYPIDINLLQSLGINFKNRVLPLKKGWLDLSVLFTIFHDKVDIFWGLSQALPLLARVPTLLFLHDIAYEYFPKFYGSVFNYRTFLSIKKATHIVTFAFSTTDDLCKMYAIDRRKITTVYQGVDSDFFYPRNSEEIATVGKKYNLPKKYFLYVGALKPIKNIGTLLRSSKMFHKKFSEYTFVLVGSDKDHTLYDLQNHSAYCYLGYVPDAYLPALYSGSQAFLHPSLYEGFGHPVLEAMACGCPVIVSNRGSLPELVGDAGIVVNPDENSLLQALTSIVKDKSLVKKLQLLGLRRSKQFSWHKFAQEVIKTTLTMKEKNAY